MISLATGLAVFATLWQSSLAQRQAEMAHAIAGADVRVGVPNTSGRDDVTAAGEFRWNCSTVMVASGAETISDEGSVKFARLDATGCSIDEPDSRNSLTPAMRDVTPARTLQVVG